MATVIINEQTNVGRSLLTIIKSLQRNTRDIRIFEDSEIEGIILALQMEEDETGEYVERQDIIKALE